MSQNFSTPRERLYLPFLSRFYESFAQPFGWLFFRIVIGGMLTIEGWQKIQDPMRMSGFVESLGFAPGWLFSPLIAIANFGGIFIVIGFLTRPFALANAVMLLVTYWFHVTHPYGDAFLTQAGIDYVNANPDLLTPAGQRRLLADGGAAFLAGPTGVQLKAELNSLFWAAGAALIAAFGGGAISVDHRMRKEF
ncbi:DoxX family protein [Rhodophyticola sp. CCM32]|uniref:DoxX family protein n=1 Tax=Rhodophyticola sp. CCM32 TaxID=2916397 RepID=UPI00107FAB13|nr:DoxX family protein [Rhodophyticola sp. CCM32]QBY00596.1 DoxX family protein [Rhodophyticola sp. CCM32]